MKPVKIIILLSLFALISMQSCKKDQIAAPELPPKSAFVPDFSDFQNDKTLLDSTYVNWTHSAANVFVWNTVIFFGLAVPVASYVEAFNHEAEFQSGTTWMWQYSFDDKFGTTYTAKLYGTVQNEMIDWEMYISRSGFYDNFLWYSGTAMSDGGSVTWILYESPSVPTELLSIEWVKTTDTTGNIKYTNIKPGGAENGGYIKYGDDGDSDLNAYYHIYNKGQDNLTEIEWSQQFKNGRVKDENKFGDTEWHCWDENLQDIDCQ